MMFDWFWRPADLCSITTNKADFLQYTRVFLKVCMLLQLTSDPMLSSQLLATISKTGWRLILFSIHDHQRMNYYYCYILFCLFWWPHALSCSATLRVNVENYIEALLQNIFKEHHLCIVCSMQHLFIYFSFIVGWIWIAHPEAAISRAFDFCFVVPLQTWVYWNWPQKNRHLRQSRCDKRPLKPLVWQAYSRQEAGSQSKQTNKIQQLNKQRKSKLASHV